MKKSEKTKKPENQESVNQTEKDLRKPEPPRFQVQFDLNYGGTYVTKEGESMTVPDMNLTVRQLLMNHTRGLSNDRHLKEPLYFDIRIPKIKDITDVHEYKEYLKGQVQNVEEFIKNEQDQKLQEDKERVEKLEKEKDQEKPKPGEQLEIK